MAVCGSAPSVFAGPQQSNGEASIICSSFVQVQDTECTRNDWNAHAMVDANWPMLLAIHGRHGVTTSMPGLKSSPMPHSTTYFAKKELQHQQKQSQTRDVYTKSSHGFTAEI